MTDACCGTCRFWLHVSEQEKVCRRYPPNSTLIPAGGISGPQTVSFFPGMKADGWCGEYRERGAVGTLSIIRPDLVAPAQSDIPSDEPNPGGIK